MQISLVNNAESLITDQEIHYAVRAINRQVHEDFHLYWNMTGTLRLEGHTTHSPVLQASTDMRGDAIIYLWHPIDAASAIAFHNRNHAGVPYGFVFPALSRALGEPWTVALSHEVLEMIADPHVNRLAIGPHPANRNASALYWYEVCDAVQNERYQVDGVWVSNFVLPLYFTPGQEMHGHNDFLCLSYGGQTLRSFGTNPGGYAGYYDPVTRSHGMVIQEGDSLGARRLEAKQQADMTRRSMRYASRT